MVLIDQAPVKPYPRRFDVSQGKKNSLVLFVFKKMSYCSLSERPFYPNLGEADPGGLGACPQERTPCLVFFFFQKKKQKALVFLDPNLGGAPCPTKRWKGTEKPHTMWRGFKRTMP
jgi:hypothetical protein